MARVLSGNLEDLAPPALLQLVAATGASGVLEIVCDAGSIRLEVVRGGIRATPGDDLRTIGTVFRWVEGSYRFSPGAIELANGDVTLDAAEFLTAARSAASAHRSTFASEMDVDALIAGEVLEMSTATGRPAIHVLPTQTVENPLDDMLVDLEASAPEELLFAQVGVVAADPRPWRGRLDRDWRHRGWQVRLSGHPHGVEPAGLDLLVIQHQLSITRVGSEEDWIDLVTKFSSAGVPVVWSGPLGDPVWTGRLVDAGIAFLLPTIQVEGGEAGQRSTAALTTVVDRLLRQGRLPVSGVDPSGAVADLVDTLLHGVEAEEILGSLLQLASTQLNRGAVFSVKETVFRCRAGYGYPLEKGSGALPRGVGLLERVIRTREALGSIEATGAGAIQLARSLGIRALPRTTTVIPLGMGAEVGGIFVGDCDGDPLPDLDEFTMLIRRLGGAVV